MKHVIPIYIYIHYLVTSIIQIYQNICSILVAPHHRGGFLVHPQPLGAPLGSNVFLKVGNQLKQAADHHPYSLSPMSPGKIPVLHENNLPKAHGNFRSLQEMDHWFTALRRRHCHGSGGKSEFSASIHINSLYFSQMLCDFTGFKTCFWHLLALKVISGTVFM